MNDNSVRINVPVKMNGHDFDRLRENSTWSPDGSPISGDLLERFEVTDKPYGTEPGKDWTVVHWVGDNPANLLLACSYLQAIGEAYEVVWDLAEWDNGQPLGYAILCHWINMSEEQMAAARAAAAQPRTTTVWRLDYQSTDFERYDTDLNHRVETALNRVGTVRDADGGTNGEVADNGFIVETHIDGKETMDVLVRSVLGERPYTLSNITHSSNRLD